MTSGEVLSQYQQRAGELLAALDVLQSRQTAAVAVIVLATLAAVVTGVMAYSGRTLPAWYPPLALAPALVSLRRRAQGEVERRRLRRLHAFLAGGVARMDGSWAGQGHSGLEFAPADHPYAGDLHLFGDGSMFERMCTARTQLGRERLARYLTAPVGREEALRRQAAVRELQGRPELRERIALLGGFDFEESKWQTFADWLGAPAAGLPQGLRPVLLGTSVCLFLMIAGAVAVPATRPLLWAPMVGLTLAHAAVGGVLMQRVRGVLAAGTAVRAEMGVMREGLAMLAGETFAAPMLGELVSRCAGAERGIAELDPWFFVLRERTKEWWYQLSLWLAAGTQCALALEAWRMRHGRAFAGWVDAWAEFEALAAVAGYAYENPEDCWPEIVEGPAYFAAEGLGHPLLARAECVRNDAALGGEVRFWMVSGSNMAGKSTLLRAVGLAAVLGLAGGPVRASAARMAAMRVYASISITDSLREGKSRFLAEVCRLRDTLAAAVAHPVLFLIDEIFSGTNSRDRQLAAEAVVRTLVARGAVGAVSTHDIALASIAAYGGVNVHMASAGADPLAFDYLVKPGVTPETNALAIARMAGVPV